MRELFRPSLVLPALILAEVAMPFSVMMARTVYWQTHHPTATVTVWIALAFVLVTYVLIEGIRHASLLTGAIVGLWAAIVGTWPSFIVESVIRSSLDMPWNGRLAWVGMLAMVPRMLTYAAGGLGLGLLVSLIPWLVHRHEPLPPRTDAKPRPTGGLLVVTMIFAVVPLVATLGLSRRVDWLLQSYAAGQHWSPAVLALFNAETAGRILVLVVGVVATFLFFMRKPIARPLTVLLLGLAVIAALFRVFEASRIPLPGTAGWRQFQSVLDILDVVVTVLAAGLGIPYFLRSQRLRAMIGPTPVERRNDDAGYRIGGSSK